MISRLSVIQGPNLSLRLIEPCDAEYVHGLRINATYNKHLSLVRGTAEDQRRWIEGYKSREAAGRELYYIIENKHARPCGTVRLYEIGPDSFTWGSWILDAGKPPKAALESAVLVYKIAFDLLDMQSADFDVRRENTNTLSFHRRFGAIETHSDHTDVFFTYPRSQYDADRESYMRILNGVVSE